MAADTAGQWPRELGDHGAAVGDTCLFHVREGELIGLFPLTEAAAFSEASRLLGSFDTDPVDVMTLVSRAWGTAVPGDRLYVCTGALGAWFLAERERSVRPWEVPGALDQAFFEVWLEDLREEGQMRAGEVTLISVEIESGIARRACA